MFKSNLVLFLLFCVTTTFAQKDVFTINDKKIKVAYPSGTVKVADNFYADDTEVSNMDYLEYLFWMERVHGTESETYVAALPDTLVWLDSLSYYEHFTEVYFRHPAYSDYPVVGVSFEQAQDYCQWRSDRVYQMLLTKQKLISDTNIPQTPSTHFTIERYQAGEYEGMLTDQPNTTIPIPEYRLPTPEEWEKLLEVPKDDKNYQHPRAVYSIHAKTIKKVEKQTKGWNCIDCYDQYVSSFLFNLDHQLPKDYSRPVEWNLAPCESYTANYFGMYNMIGNIAEMTATEGTAKGGSLKHTLAEAHPSQVQKYDAPKAWLGFRCVCSWKFVK